MFGKSAWFRPKRWGWGLTPITWQGWLYALIWCGILAVPFVLLIASHKIPEAIIWQAASMTLLIWDVKQMLACYRTAPSSGQVSSAEGRSAERGVSADDPEAEIEFLDEEKPESHRQWFSRQFRFCLRR